MYHVDALASKALGQKRLGESETVFNERQREREREGEREKKLQTLFPRLTTPVASF